MMHRRIGNASVSAVGFGLFGLNGAVRSDMEWFEIMDAAFASGCTFWDTADIHNEEIIGKWLKRNPGKRSSIFLATQFGFMRRGARRGSNDSIRQQCERSLELLGVEYIDLYYQHRVDPKVPIEVTVGAMAELVREGKVKYLGLSDCTAAGLCRAHAVHPISAIQIEYSPFMLQTEQFPLNLVQTATELGVMIVARAPLGRGLLTGNIRSRSDLKLNDFRRMLSMFGDENFPKITSLVDRIRVIADRHMATPGQIALAWILAQGSNFIVVPGACGIEELEENVGGASMRLTDAEVTLIRKYADATKCSEDRYGPGLLQMIYVCSPERQRCGRYSS